MPKKEERSIFVIMPFRSTPKRDQQQLAAFFHDHLRGKLENTRFKYKYTVRRSDDTFNITEKIIKDVYEADIVLCDLSGNESNPNVMYELGMRLALTHQPVILIREGHEANKPIFDISGFYAHPYDPLNYAPLLEHLIQKIKRLETGEEQYRSPVLAILEANNPLLERMSLARAREKLLFMKAGLMEILRIFASAIVQYFRQKGVDFAVGTKVDEIIPKINERRSEFEEIDFSDFHCTLSTQPMIDSYLADQYLNNIAPPKIIATFTLFAIKYHAYYLGLDVFHNRWTANYVYMFFGETQIFMQMLDALFACLIAENDEERQTMIDAVEELRKQSLLA